MFITALLEDAYWHYKVGGCVHMKRNVLSHSNFHRALFGPLGLEYFERRSQKERKLLLCQESSSPNHPDLPQKLQPSRNVWR